MNSRSGTILSLGLFISGCTVTTVPVKGDPGPPGDTGLQGPPGVPDNAAISALQTTVATLQMHVAELQTKNTALELTVEALQSKADKLQTRVDALESQSSDPECPVGYSKVAKPFLPNNSDSVLCKSGDDEVVRVGSGGAAFWIDRYEASIWDGPTQRFANNDNTLDPFFPKNGQTNTPWMAKSISDVTPARYLTWFQAQSACRASRKRLATGAEWLAAARGTVDPNSNDGTVSTKCNTAAASVRKTGSAGDPTDTAQVDGCFSDWGAEDMVGNVQEMTDQWYAMVLPEENATWPAANYASDQSTGIGPSACLTGANGGCSTKLSVPIPARLGGSWYGGLGAGTFAVSVDSAPATWHESVGFRCVLSR